MTLRVHDLVIDKCSYLSKNRSEQILLKTVYFLAGLNNAAWEELEHIYLEVVNRHILVR
jgi:hypothetical protein